MGSTDRLLRAIIDSSDDAIIGKRLDGVITSWNRSAERMFGYSAEEAVGKTVAELLIPRERADEEVEILARIKRGERVDHLQTIRRSKEGAILDISLTVSPIRDPSGAIVAASTIARDVTEKKRAARMAHLLSAIVDSSDDAIISKNLEGVVTSWNQSAQRLFGYTASEAVGKTVAELLIPADRQDEEPQILGRLARGERVDHFETIRRRKDGTLLDISLTISPVRDAEGRIIGASKIARDITEAKRIRTALAESEARFRQLADSMPQMVWTAQPDGRIDYYNERWYEFTRLPRDVFSEAGWQSVLHPEDVEPVTRSYYEAIRSGQSYTSEYRMWDSRDCRWRWFVGRGVAVRSADGSVAKWFGTHTDIDQQKRVETELRRANENLEQFAYSVSHDLQEPLRNIKIYSELLSARYGQGLEASATQFLRFVRDGATRMEALVRDLLTYTKIQRGDEEPESCDADECLKAAISDLSLSVRESGAQVEGTPLPTVPMHFGHLHQIFQNLLSNAIKYRSPERRPVIRVHAERKDEHWVFAVADNGIGIDPEYKENIFGLFKRLHTNDQYSGTGIGLAICRRIVDRYHGRIWVESEPGQGSTFRFSFPA